MARLEIIWRNPRFVQPRRLWTQAGGNEKRCVYLVAEPVTPEEESWHGLPNLELIRNRAFVKPAVGMNGR